MARNIVFLHGAPDRFRRLGVHQQMIELRIIRQLNVFRPVKRLPGVDAVRVIPENMRIKNDGEVLDLIIQKFSAQLKTGEVDITPAVALKAIDMKKSMLGTKYKGQTVWSLMESQLQFDTLIEIMGKFITNDQFEAIMQELESKGAVTTQRPATVRDVESILDRELAKELDVPDPLEHIDG